MVSAYETARIAEDRAGLERAGQEFRGVLTRAAEVLNS